MQKTCRRNTDFLITSNPAPKQCKGRELAKQLSSDVREQKELSIREEPANNFPHPNQKITL